MIKICHTWGGTGGCIDLRSFPFFRVWKLIEAWRWLQNAGAVGPAIWKVDSIEVRFYARFRGKSTMKNTAKFPGVCGWPCLHTLRVFDSCDTTQHMYTTGYLWKINDWRVYPDCFSIGLSIGSTFWTRKKARHQMRRLFVDITDWHRHTTELNSSFESE